MQLELEYYPRDCVRGVLRDYVAMRAETCTAETIENDYRWRVDWLLQVFGEMTPALAIGYDAMERAARAGRAVLLKDVTTRKRLTFWCAAVEYAAMRGVPVMPAPVPPWLKNDATRYEDFYTPVQFAAFRMALPPGRFRALGDLGMWTGMHRLDLFAMEPDHLEPAYDWGGGRRGRWLRKNHKNRKCSPAWMPMEPELRALCPELLELLPIRGLNNVARAFQTAAARAELPAVRPNLGLRASHSTLLMARGYAYEYVRQVLGHEGEMYRGASGRAATAKRATTLTRHYLRTSPDLLRGGMK